jgi:hypothetical protein
MDRPNVRPVLPVVTAAHNLDKRSELELKTDKQYIVADLRTIADAGRQRRFKFEVDIQVKSQTCGLLKGYSVDISESGIAAMLVTGAPVGEVVELDFTLPYSPVTIRALVREKNAFRHGFEFLDSDSMHEVIRRTCSDLAVQQSLIFPNAR